MRPFSIRRSPGETRLPGSISRALVISWSEGGLRLSSFSVIEGEVSAHRPVGTSIQGLYCGVRLSSKPGGSYEWETCRNEIPGSKGPQMKHGSGSSTSDPMSRPDRPPLLRPGTGFRTREGVFYPLAEMMDQEELGFLNRCRLVRWYDDIDRGEAPAGAAPFPK